MPLITAPYLSRKLGSERRDCPAAHPQAKQARRRQRCAGGAATRHGARTRWKPGAEWRLNFFST